MKVEVADQVLEFVRGLSPEPKRKLRQALHALAADDGDIKPLVAPLAGYSRLRVGAYRVIFRRIMRDGQPVAQCVYAERRAVVYDKFSPLHP